MTSRATQARISFSMTSAYFVYASVSVPHDQAVDIVAKMRTESRTQSSELKFDNLMKYSRPRRRAMVSWHSR